MSKKTRTREDIRADLDASYETEFYQLRVMRRAPWKLWSIGFNILMPLIIGGLFQMTVGWIIGWIVIYFAIDFFILGFRQWRWNRNVKRYGLESFRAQFDPFYTKEENDK